MQIGLRSSSKQELTEIQLRFDAYKNIHGDLFEDAIVPLTEEDMVDAVARRERFSKIFLILYICGMILIGLVLFISPAHGEDYFYIGAFIGVPLIFRMMILSGFDTAISNKEKRVVHGVITRKQIKGSRINVEFSGRLTVEVQSADYKILKLGDIVRIEILAKEVLIKRKIVVEGRI